MNARPPYPRLIESDEQRPIDLVLSRLDGVIPSKSKQGVYYAFCKAHDDRHKRSLRVTENAEGKVGLHCYKPGCTFDRALASLHLEARDLYPAHLKQGSSWDREVARYPYVDEDGVLLYEIVRFAPKRFVAVYPDAGAVGETDRRVLYRLPEVLPAIGAGQRIYFCEGEKDADNLRAVGLVATACAYGCHGWRVEFAYSLAGADLVILPHNDKGGRELARQVASDCRPFARSVRVLALPNLPPDGGDVSNWLAQGHTAEELEQLAGATLVWHPKGRAAAATKISSAIGFLYRELAHGPRLGPYLIALAEEHDISRRTLYEAAKRAGIVMEQPRREDGTMRPARWMLPVTKLPERTGVDDLCAVA